MAIMPGQVTTYGVGEQELFPLREEARQALGPKFDLREFHDRVLENGSLTLGMLRKVIERWIAEEKAGEAQGSSAGMAWILPHVDAEMLAEPMPFDCEHDGGVT